jgi:hypothetical protein
MAGAIAAESVTPFYFRKLSEMDSLLKVNELVEQLEDYLENHSLETLDDLYQLRNEAGHV